MKSDIKADKLSFCTFWCQACLRQSKDDIFGAKLDQGQGQGQGRTTTGRLILTYWTTTTENGTTSRRSHANSHPAGSFFAWHQIQDRRTHLPTGRILEY